MLLGGGQTLDIPAMDTLKGFHAHLEGADGAQVVEVAARNTLPRPEISPVFRMKESRMLDDNFDGTKAFRKTAADEALLALVVGDSRVIARPSTPRSLFASIEARDMSGRARVKHPALFKELLSPPRAKSAGDLAPGRKAYYSFTKGIEWKMVPRGSFRQEGSLRPWEEQLHEYAESLRGKQSSVEEHAQKIQEAEGKGGGP